MDMNSHAMLGNAWFGLIGLMLIFYVVTDGFDLGVGILSLFTRREQERNLIFQSIAHVWDANETWLVVVGGALFGAFPSAYATLLEQLYIPIMLLTARGFELPDETTTPNIRRVLVKPFSPRQILACVNELLSREGVSQVTAAAS